MSDVILWRYMSLCRLNEIIDSGKLYFPSASQFSDPLEGAVKCIPIHSEGAKAIECFKNKNFLRKFESFESAFKILQELVKISCWHMSESECSLMWNYYAKDCKGVVIQTTKNRLMSSLKPYLATETARSPEKFYFKRVRYYLSEEGHQPSTSMIERFFYKHKAFSSEKEFRVIVDLRYASENVPISDQGIRVDADLDKLIEKIHTAPGMFNNIMDELKKKYASHTILSRVEPSAMDLIPIFSG